MEPLTDRGKDYCVIQNNCPNAITVTLPGGSTFSLNDNKEYHNPPDYCYGRCPVPYVPPPACLLLKQTAGTCTVTNNCDKIMKWVIKLGPDSYSGGSTGVGQTGGYSLECAKVLVKNDVK